MTESFEEELLAVRRMLARGKAHDALILAEKLEAKDDLTQEDLTKCKIIKGWILLFLDKFEEVLNITKEIEEFSKKSGDLLLGYQAKQLEHGIDTFKSDYTMAFSIVRDYNDFFEQFRDTTSLYFQRAKADYYFVKGTALFLKYELDSSLNYILKSLDFFKKHPEIEFSKAWCYAMLSFIYFGKGDLENALINGKKYLEKHKFNCKFENKVKADIYRNIGDIHSQRGDYEDAIENYQKALNIYSELNEKIFFNTIHRYMVELFVRKSSFKKANEWLDRLQNLAGKKSTQYKSAKVSILRSTGRVRDQAEAEILLKQIINEAVNPFGSNPALLQLCSMYIKELNLTGRLEILDDIHPLIEALIDNSTKGNSYSLHAQTKLLQAKVSLIQMDFGSARRLLTEAQKLADKWGLNILAASISKEHDQLMNQLNKWDELKRNDAPVSDRMKLASIEPVTEIMLERRPVDIVELEMEQPVSMVVFSKTGYTVFSNKFTADVDFDEKLIGSIVSMSSRGISESLERLKFGEFTILLEVIDTLVICYIFRGQSYGAGQKLGNFTESLKERGKILEIFNTAIRTGAMIKLNENPDLEELITDCFLSDPKKFKLPFNAYKGDEPFVFVSYAHSDKLQVYPIIDYLNKSGFNVWYDEGISVSEDWKKSIVKNIENCSVFLVFITPHIIDSEYVRKEISYALNQKKPFYSVYLKDTELPGELVFDISGIQSMKKYTMPDKEFYSKITQVLAQSVIKKNI